MAHAQAELPDFSITLTLTGNRTFVFNIVCFVTGLIAGVVWIVLYPRVAQTTLDNTAADVLKFCIVAPLGGGALCALWEKWAASKLPPDVEDE